MIVAVGIIFYFAAKGLAVYMRLQATDNVPSVTGTLNLTEIVRSQQTQTVAPVTSMYVTPDRTDETTSTVWIKMSSLTATPSPSPSRTPTPKPTRTPTPTPTPFPAAAIEGEFKLWQALQLIYSSGEIAYFKDEVGLLCITERPCTGVIAGKYTINVLLERSFYEEDSVKYVVMTGVIATEYLDDHFHSLSPSIDGAIFSRTGDEWQMVTKEHSITYCGQFGYAPQGELVQIGRDRYGFLFHCFYANTGHQAETTYIFAPGEREWEFRRILEVQTLKNRLAVVQLADVQAAKSLFRQPSVINEVLYSDNGDITGVLAWLGYSSKVELVPGEGVTYYDARITTTQTYEEPVVCGTPHVYGPHGPCLSQIVISETVDSFPLPYLPDH